MQYVVGRCLCIGIVDVYAGKLDGIHPRNQPANAKVISFTFLEFVADVPLFCEGKDVDVGTIKAIEKQKEVTVNHVTVLKRFFTYFVSYDITPNVKLLTTLLRQKESLLPLPSPNAGVQAAFHFYKVQPTKTMNVTRISVIPSDFVLLNNGAVMEPNDLRFTTLVKGNYYFSLTVKKPLEGPYSNLLVKFYRNGTVISPTNPEEKGVLATTITTNDGQPEAGQNWLLRKVEMTLPLEANDKVRVQIEIDGDEENKQSLATDKITQWYYGIVSYRGFIIKKT
ncbi:hypothetical protein GHT06_013778 [Daphnia sinensis]|uniref:Uncharacterized protein n=1 Tax=Daphnia sinensis TaxID=1820382 RepID=A0AAD5PUI3_9CRUS|nr:hypothetical protein GHT06_013778 [Daphnia sinensis]